jgi:hypothetical protein
MARGLGAWVRACWVAAVAVSGCGSDAKPPPPNCGEVQPSGGDVVGTWRFLGGCANVAEETAELEMSCPGAAVRGFTTTISGSITFNADLTYTTPGWNQMSASSEIYPLACTGAASCATVRAPQPAQDPGLRLDCTGTDPCACTLVDTTMLPADAGTYTISNTLLTRVGPQTAFSSQFSVEGSRLHLLQISNTRVGPNLEAIVLGDTVAERQ